MILNKTNRHSDRLHLIPEGMGGAGDPIYSPHHKWSIASGVNRGNGYQGYMQILYFLTKCEWAPEEAKQNCIRALQEKGYGVWLQHMGLTSKSDECRVAS